MALPPDSYFLNDDFVRLEEHFHDYVAQGEGRSINWLAQKSGLPITTVARGMVAGSWMARLAAVARDAARQTQKDLATDVAGLNTRDVVALSAFIELTDRKLAEAIEKDLCSPAVLAKVNFDARARRREALGLGAGGEGDIVNKMAKLLESSTTEKPESEFVLDRKALAMPPELPTMPGQISEEGADDQDDQQEEIL